MKEYNELIAGEVNDLAVKLVTLLQEEDSYDKHGIAALLLTAADGLMQMADGKKPTIQDMRVAAECIRLLTPNVGATSLLLAQLGKTFEMVHLGFYEGRK